MNILSKGLDTQIFYIQTLSYRILTPHSSPLVRTLLQRGKFLQQELSSLCLSNASTRQLFSIDHIDVLLKVNPLNERQLERKNRSINKIGDPLKLN